VLLLYLFLCYWIVSLEQISMAHGPSKVLRQMKALLLLVSVAKALKNTDS
jgi:hypothetical protein